MPAQLGQLANFNFPAYIPQRRPGVGEELLAGIVGQIAKNHMSPDYSPELAERGIEGVDNNWFTALTGGNRTNVDDFNSIAQTVNSEERTGVQREGMEGLKAQYDAIKNDMAARLQLGRDQLDSDDEQWADEIALQASSNQLQNNISMTDLAQKASALDEVKRMNDLMAGIRGQEERGLRMENDLSQMNLDTMQLSSFMGRVPSVYPKEVINVLPSLYAKYKQATGQPPADVESLLAWNREQQPDAPTVELQPELNADGRVTPVNPVADAEREMAMRLGGQAESFSDNLRYLLNLLDMTENTAMRKEAMTPEGAYDYYQSKINQ